MLVQGDDNCMRHLENVSFPWQEGMKTLGFESEAIYRKHYFEVEFCSNRLYKTKTGQLVFGPKPGRVLAKCGYVINPPANVSRESMMRGIALGLKRSCNFIPPLSATVDRILELTDGHQAWFERKQFSAFQEEKDPLKMTKMHEYSPEVLLNLNHHYDWDNGKQIMYASQIKNMQLGDSIRGIADLLLDRDTSGPQVIFGGFVQDDAPAAA